MPRSGGKRTMQTDNLHNLLSGMGGQGDKSIYTMFGHVGIQREQLEAAYRNDWISRKVIDIPSQDATRKWREWQADKEDITAIEEVEQDFNLKRKTMIALQKARLYGGGALILGINQGKPEDEVNLDTLGKDSLKFIHAVSRYEITGSERESDIMSPYYGEPKYYERTTVNGGLMRLHPSRVVKFIGLEYPDPSSAPDAWGDPVLQVVAAAIKATGTVCQGVAQLIDEAKVDIIKIPDLTASILDKDYEARLKARFGLASDAKSIYKMLLLDKEEEWERIEQNFSGLDALVQMYMLIASGAADIPATRLLGQSPKGLSATGESDIRNYYDRIQTEQETINGPALERLDEVLVRSALGDYPEGLHFEWRALWQMDEVQQAELENKKATTFKIDVDAGVLDGAVLKSARENQLIEDGTYPGIEQIIDELGEEYQEPDPLLALPAPGMPGQKLLPPPKGGAGPKGAPANPNAAQAKRVKAADVRQRRTGERVMRRVMSDAQPKTLYVRRDVLNHKDIASHFKKQGFKTTLGEAMHVTIAYSRAPVDWMKAGEAWGQDEKGHLNIVPGGVRIVEKFQESTVLLFVCRELEWRWCQIKENTGATWKWPEYQPHITLAYTGAPADISKVLPYVGPIVLGPEVFEEVNTDYADLVVEDAKAAKLWPTG